MVNIAIAGYGQEGESSYRYYSKNPKNKLTIVDQRTPNRELPLDVPSIIGEQAFEKLEDFDLVIRTASLSPGKIRTKGLIWSATNEFFEKCPAEIIGVTGTKGKGTTASLIANLFEAVGKKVWLLGNIGVAPLDFLEQIKKDDVVVYELSSFQAWDLKKSPHVAVVLPISPEHLDVHIDFADYVGAKANIRRHQKPEDVCIYHSTNQYSYQIAKLTAIGSAIRYGVVDDGGVYVKEGYFCQNEHKICPTEALQLVGGHNVDNACAAITVAKQYGLSDDDVKKGLGSFHGLEHRLEFVRELNGVRYYNDSFSSSTPATIAAIKSFDQPEILIMGGIDRGGDFDEIAKVISDNNNVKAVIVIGQIRDKLAKILARSNQNLKIESINATNMSDIVKSTQSYAQSGDVVILSPGCASFDMFKDFTDRGNQFKDVVKSL